MNLPQIKRVINVVPPPHGQVSHDDSESTILSVVIVFANIYIHDVSILE